MMPLRPLARIVALLAATTLLLASGCTGRDLREAPQVDASADSTVIPDPDAATQRLFEETMAYAREQNLHDEPIGVIMVRLGERFMGKPYAAGLLDEPAQETLVCTLNEFDCVTFVESVLAMGRAIQRQTYDYEEWARNMLDLRYRDGEMDGYCSRLHYFSDWIRDNERRGNVRNVTEDAGGEPLEKNVRFMSQHRDLYPRFAENDTTYRCILDMERSLAGTELFYIPQDRIAEAYSAMQGGDIVAMTSSVGGLDVAHTGLIYDDGDDSMGLLHASTSGGVKVSPDLQSYVQGVSGQTGIILARPSDAR